MDTSRNGKISMSELKKYFIKKDLHYWDQREFFALWKDGDSDGDSQIDLNEFRQVMRRAARTSSNVHTKWKELLEKIKAESGTPLEVRLFKVGRSYNASMIVNQPVVGNSKKTITTSFPKLWFEVGKTYFVTLNEAGTSSSTELARTEKFECIDSGAARRAYVEAQIRRARIAERNRKEQEEILRQLSVESHDDMVAKIEARRRAAKRTFTTAKLSRRAVVVIDDLFHKIDVNRNGTISSSEFRNHVRSSGVTLSTGELNQMFHEADKDDNNKISLFEFRTAMNLAKNKASSYDWIKLYSYYERQIGSKRSRYR